MLASDLMATDLICLNPSDSVIEAAKKMVEHKISVLPIINSERRLLGIITQSDFVGKEIDIPHALVNIKHLLGQDFYNQDIEAVFNRAKHKPVEEVMTKKPVTVSAETDLNQVVRLLIEKNLKRLPVVENDKLAGIITRRDILKAFLKLT